MARSATVYRCQQCGHEVVRWLGRCPACEEWNTLVEEQTAPAPDRRRPASRELQPQTLMEVEPGGQDRLLTGVGELDRVLGGGIVPGSLVLVGGDPGVGKSTLMLQVSTLMARAGCRCLYASGEESPRQLRLRAERLGMTDSDLLVVAETDLDRIGALVGQQAFEVLVVDSIQTLFLSDLASAPGTVTQVRECTAYLSRLAKAAGMAVLVIGHVTKEGFLAGPKVMEHIVDTVLYFEGDRHQQYRILRAVKNRFGSTNEIGLFAMTGQGLRPIDNPSEFLLSQRPLNVSGSVIVCTMEGTRPLLVEVQALVSPSHLGVPRRVATGIDFQRLSLTLAVLEKRAGLRLGHHDVYVNVAGGLRVEEPAADLAVALAIASSLKDVAIGPHLVVFGELGLAGEVRAVSHTERRVQEAERLGFQICVLPARSGGGKRGGIEQLPVQTVVQALQDVLLMAEGYDGEEKIPHGAARLGD